MQELKVVCGIIFRKEKFFIAKRKEDKSMAGKWEFPGGRVEKGETEEEFNVFLKTGFIRSEVREEDGILLIDEESVFELIEIHDQLLASRIINVNELQLNSQKSEKD